MISLIVWMLSLSSGSSFAGDVVCRGQIDAVVTNRVWVEAFRENNDFTKVSIDVRVGVTYETARHPDPVTLTFDPETTENHVFRGKGVTWMYEFGDDGYLEHPQILGGERIPLECKSRVFD